MNNIRYGLSIKILYNKKDKESTIPTIKPNILNNRHSF